METSNVEMSKVEVQLNHRLLYNVRAQAEGRPIDFPIGIQEEGSASRDEAGVLRATLAFAEGLAVSVRLRLDQFARDS